MFKSKFRKLYTKFLYSSKDRYRKSFQNFSQYEKFAQSVRYVMYGIAH